MTDPDKIWWGIDHYFNCPNRKKRGIEMITKEKLWTILIVLFFIILFGFIAVLTVSTPGCTAGFIDTNIIPDTPQKMLYKTVAKTNWLVTLSILGIGAGAFSFFNGNLKGIKFAAACLVVLGIVLMLTRYGTWVAFIALAASVGLPILTIYLNRSALKQIVTGVQNVKDDTIVISDNMRKRANRILTNIQSPETQAMVKRIKDKSEKVSRL